MSDDQIRNLGEKCYFDPTEGPNPVLDVDYDANDNPIKFTKAINGISYEKTLTWAVGTSGFVLTNVTPWTKV